MAAKAQLLRTEDNLKEYHEFYATALPILLSDVISSKLDSISITTKDCMSIGKDIDEFQAGLAKEVTNLNLEELDSGRKGEGGVNYSEEDERILKIHAIEKEIDQKTKSLNAIVINMKDCVKKINTKEMAKLKVKAKTPLNNLLAVVNQVFFNEAVEKFKWKSFKSNILTKNQGNELIQKLENIDISKMNSLDVDNLTYAKNEAGLIPVLKDPVEFPKFEALVDWIHSLGFGYNLVKSLNFLKLEIERMNKEKIPDAVLKTVPNSFWISHKGHIDQMLKVTMDLEKIIKAYNVNIQDFNNSSYIRTLEYMKRYNALNKAIDELE